MTPTLLLQEVMDKYELNDFRVAVLTKLQGKLHDNLVDQVGCDWSPDLTILTSDWSPQLPMLHHLKKWLAQISIARPPPAKPTLIMELVPAIKEGIEKQVNCTLNVSAPGEAMFDKIWKGA